MLNEVNNKTNKDESTPSAFIFYSPPTSSAKEQIFYNQEAWGVLSIHESAYDENKIDFTKLSSICSDWKTLVDNHFLENPDLNLDSSPEAIYIGIIHSYRRRYAVKAVVLSKSTLKKQERNYLFILERFTPENNNLLKIIRDYHLSKREQDILHLLVKGYSNKEIAYELNLSLNTIKTYMRLLMNKFNVGNRSSIIADLLKKGA